MAAHLAPTDGPAMPASVQPTPGVRVLGLAIGLTAVLALLVVAFAWPATQLAPRSLPIVVAGPAEAAGQAQAALNTAMPGGFAVTVVTDEAAARAAIERRDAYGGLVLGNPPTVLTASAASPIVAQLMSQLGTTLAARQTGAAAPAVRVVDVVSLPATDPRGAGLASLALPMVIGGIAVGAAAARAVTGMRRKLVAVILTAVFAGFALVGIAQGWLGFLTGTWWAEAAVIALGIAATAVALVGLDALIGVAGVALGAGVVMLLGNPLSGLTSAPEMLPSGWGTLGQWLPPGAMGTLLRTVTFFPNGSWSPAVWILTGWVVGGLLLAWLGSRRHPVAGRHEDGVPVAEEPDLVRR